MGLAAVLRQWEYEDGTKGGVGAEAGAAPAAGGPPTPEDLAAAGGCKATEGALGAAKRNCQY